MHACVCVLVNLIIHLPLLQVVLDDFSLTIPAGKVTALCGLSGAGQLGSSGSPPCVGEVGGGCGLVGRAQTAWTGVGDCYCRYWQYVKTCMRSVSSGC